MSHKASEVNFLVKFFFSLSSPIFFTHPRSGAPGGTAPQIPRSLLLLVGALMVKTGKLLAELLYQVIWYSDARVPDLYDHDRLLLLVQPEADIDAALMCVLLDPQVNF